MFRILFHTPEIPGNTGNAIRLAAITGAELHLVEPLGFDFSDAKLRRAGLDYHDLAVVTVHPDIDAAWAALAPERVFAFTSDGETSYTDISYRPGDVLHVRPRIRGPARGHQARPPRHVPRAPADASLAAFAEPCERSLDRGLRGLAPERIRTAPSSSRRNFSCAPPIRVPRCSESPVKPSSTNGPEARERERGAAGDNSAGGQAPRPTVCRRPHPGRSPSLARDRRRAPYA